MVKLMCFQMVVPESNTASKTQRGGGDGSVLLVFPRVVAVYRSYYERRTHEERAIAMSGERLPSSSAERRGFSRKEPRT